MARRAGKILKGLSALAVGALVLLLMLYMGGVLTVNKIGPADKAGDGKLPAVPPLTAAAAVQTVNESYEAIGTVRPRTESTVEAQISARVEEVLVKPGQMVTRGATLVILDDREFRSRLARAEEGLAAAKARREQAIQGLAAARALLTQSEAAHNRTRAYVRAEAATLQDMEKAEAAFLQAQAGARQAEDAIREAEAGIKKAQNFIEEARISLGYTKIAAHEDGQVAKRIVEPGDVAMPGKPLLVLQTINSLRLEAIISEAHIQKVAPGTRLKGTIEALSLSFDATVEELIPAGDPNTRTFLVKVALPSDARIFPGMFGRVIVPLGEIKVVTVPRNAITKVGQLDTVIVKTADTWKRVLVKTGRNWADRVEVLSGLTGYETVAVSGEGRDVR